MAEQVLTSPAPETTVPATFALHYRIAVTNVAATLASLLPGGLIPTIPLPVLPTGGSSVYAFGWVDLASEVDPAVTKVRITRDGQTTPTATLGTLVPQEPGCIRVAVPPDKIRLIGNAAGPTNVQVVLGITAIR